ncbi:hypothetical protein ACFL33_02775, partial [Pseudomonadota bacterium]
GWFATWRKGNSELIDTVRQAAAFHARYGNRLEPTAAAAAGAYCEILQAGRLRRFDALQRSDAWRRHWLLDATLILRLLSLKAPD